MIVLASTAPSSAQAQSSAFPTAPLNLTFLKAQLGDALAMIATSGGITIEYDGTITDEIRRAPLSQETIRLVNATLEQALGTLTSMNGLTYTITGPKAVRISKKV